MAGGGLHDPLGTDRPPKAARSGSSFFLIALIGVLVGFAVLFAIASFRDSGERGEPRSVAEIGPVHHIDPAPASPAPGSASTTTLPPGLPGGSVPSSDQEVEIENGVRVIRPRRDTSATGSLVVKVPNAAAAPAAPPAAPRLETGSSRPLSK